MPAASGHATFLTPDTIHALILIGRVAVTRHQEHGKGGDFEQWCWGHRIPYFRAQLEECFLYKKDQEAKRKAHDGDEEGSSEKKGSSQPQYFLKGVR
jgi:hypothetical protein